MRKLKILFLFAIMLFSFSACEKDDICVDADTALLIIRFYDAENPTAFKAVPNLRVIGVGNGSPVDTFVDRSSTLDSIGIPLITNTSLSSFDFIINSGDDEDAMETGNIDTITFNYEVKESFESRACGFVAVYENLNSNFITNSEDWIQSIEVVKTIVQTEETVTAHVKVFH